MSHSSYSPGNAPSYCYLFFNLQNYLIGKNFKSFKNVKRAFTSFWIDGKKFLILKMLSRLFNFQRLNILFHQPKPKIRTYVRTPLQPLLYLKPFKVKFYFAEWKCWNVPPKTTSTSKRYSVIFWRCRASSRATLTTPAAVWNDALVHTPKAEAEERRVRRRKRSVPARLKTPPRTRSLLNQDQGLWSGGPVGRPSSRCVTLKQEQMIVMCLKEVKDWCLLGFNQHLLNRRPESFRSDVIITNM